MMNKPAEKPDWTEYPSMVRFYEQAQAAEGSLELDEAFLHPRPWAWLAVELKTGSVWNVVRELQGDTCTFVNGSMEQFLLSMAYWRFFYAGFSEKVRAFQNGYPDRSELDYIFKSRRSLYAPFLERLKALDPEAAKKRTGFWRFMCDLSLH